MEQDGIRSELIDSLVLDAFNAKQALSDAQERFLKVEAALTEEMAVFDTHEMGIEHEGRDLVVKLVTSERVKFDDEGIRKEIGPQAFLLLSRVTLDPGKIKQALVDGTIDPLMLDRYTTAYQAKPYLRFSWGDPVD